MARLELPTSPIPSRPALFAQEEAARHSERLPGFDRAHHHAVHSLLTFGDSVLPELRTKAGFPRQSGENAYGASSSARRRTSRIINEYQSVTIDDRVEARGIERDRALVEHIRRYAHTVSCPPRRCGHHRWRNVREDHTPARTDALGSSETCSPGARGQVKNHGILPDPSRIEQRLRGESQLGVDELGVSFPARRSEIPHLRHMRAYSQQPHQTGRRGCADVRGRSVRVAPWGRGSSRPTPPPRFTFFYTVKQPNG